MDRLFERIEHEARRGTGTDSPPHDPPRKGVDHEGNVDEPGPSMDVPSSYGRPRMTMEIKEAGLDIGERRVGRLMRLNGIKLVRTSRHKVTT